MTLITSPLNSPNQGQRGQIRQETLRELVDETEATRNQVEIMRQLEPTRLDRIFEAIFGVKTRKIKQHRIDASRKTNAPA